MKSDPNNPKSVSARARMRRVRLFATGLEKIHDNLKEARGLNVLDIGGTVNFWRSNAKYIPSHLINVVEVVNLPPIIESDENVDGIRLKSYGGNALDINSLRSSHYDVVHSNSVIEHVGNLSAQIRFGKNILSLADYHFIQTPCRMFPIEPHFFFPFFALLPLSTRSLLLRNFNMGFMERERDWLTSRVKCEETRLLTKKELMHIFDNSECLPERMFLMVKSWMLTNMFRKTI